MAKDIYLEKFGLDATTFSLLAGGTQRKTTWDFFGCPLEISPSKMVIFWLVVTGTMQI